MKNLSFRNRIALNYIISTALLIGAVFIVIFMIVKINVSNDLNKDLQEEINRHSKEIEIKNGTIALKNHKEWMEREHNTVGVSPVFIEFLDADGNLIDKSPNLKGSHLLYNRNQKDNIFYDGELVQKRVRQVQVTILDTNQAPVGHLLVAVAREGAEVVIETLCHILLISYPLILIVLFFIARLIAGRSIQPIDDIIQISNKITRDNLDSRIELPQNKDELYILSNNINSLLDRLKQTIEREKSFTSYASHEFRTPLAILKGSLEVLIRKPRQVEEYQAKIKYCINQIDRLNHLVDELLILTRYENQKQSLNITDANIKVVVEETIQFFHRIIEDKNIQIRTEIAPIKFDFKTDRYLFSTIINNIVSNAIKYSKEGGKIEINIHDEGNLIHCEVKDHGMGIASKDLDKIFDKFYRSADHSDIKGFGLGLPIVKRFCTLLNIRLEIASIENIGTTVELQIPKS